LLVLLFWLILIGMAYFVYGYNKWLFYALLIVWAVSWSFVFKKLKHKILFLVPLLLLFILYGLLHLPNVQTKLTRIIAADLSEKLHTKVSVKHVDISFFNKVAIEEVMVEDLKKDTLLYAGTIQGSVNDWFFLKDKIAIENVQLSNVVVKLHRSDSVWNYQYLVDYFSSPKTKKSGGAPLDIDLKELHLNNVRFNKIDEWLGEDMIANLKKVDVTTDLIDTKNKKINIKAINIDKPFFAIKNYDRKKPESARTTTEPIAVQSEYKWNTDGWEIKLQELNLKNGVFKDDKISDDAALVNQFDGQHLFFSSINVAMKNLHYLHDTISVNTLLSTKEKCGLDVKKLYSNIKFTPDIMEFNNLDLVLNRSHLKDYYAMKYESFNRDFGSFLHNVKLEGHFKESVVNSDDIAFFAPGLKSWKRSFYLEGNAKGPIDNFSAKDLKIRTGNTVLDGNIALRGLPDVNSTFIDFQSKELRTNYTDLVSLIPAVKDIEKPSIAKLGEVNFVGNFTGFIRDFVAFGKFNTALGNITADVNMKTPEGSPAKYSGSIASNGFNIGSFITSKNIGNVALNVKIDGTGFSLKDLKEKINGTVSSIQLGNYTYKNLVVNGDFEKKLFEGHFAINDPNLQISNLDGSINFVEKNPGFKLQAKVQKADLKKLGLVKDNFLFNGDLDLDFTGNSIDNFLGNAKVTNAKLLQGDSKLSFDFLNINSEIVAGKKSLTINTNEMDANVTGNFKIMELPDAVRVLLSKYYPAYIKAPKYIVKSAQDFAFSIKTKEVDGYAKLIDKRLGGFNNATIDGNFNLQNYDLILNATVPQFSYDGKIFNKLNLQSTGNRDSLISHITADDITINDNFHLPNSTLQLSTSNDVSLIKLNTSASKIFGNAELNASVETLNDGVKIHFSPSSFIINNKKWQLDKDGELVLQKQFINASEVKFYNNTEAIILKTELDPEGITNETHLVAELKNVAIEDFAFILPKKPELKGNITGTLNLSKIFGKQNLAFKGEVNDFTLDKKLIGKVKIDEANFSTTSGIVKYNGSIDEKDYAIDFSGSYNTKDSMGSAIQNNITARKLNLDILKPYLAGIFSDVKGFANGKLQLVQTNKKLQLIGDAIINDASLKVGYTQVRYNFDNQLLRFGKNFIDVGTLQIKDTLGNKGLVSGKIYHSFFDNFSFDNLNFSTDRMLLLNTTKKDNKQFYGKIIGNASMSLDGDISNMKMNIAGEPSKNILDSNHVYLPTGDTKEGNVIDYIDFVPFGSLMESDKGGKDATNLLVNLELTSNPACKIDVILDEQTGDIIKGQGSGKLNIKVGTNEPLTINGTYELSEGKYAFNFQTFFNVPFLLSKGGTIVWNGDPFQASLNMDAEYLAKNVDIKSITTNTTTRQQEDVRIVSHISGVLKKPIINFELLLPARSSLNRDYYVTKKLADFKNDENVMNKQVASLLLFNQFISDQQGFITGGSTFNIATNTIGGAISSWLTNTLSRALEKATKGVVSFNVDVNPTLNSQDISQIQANIRSSLEFRVTKNIRINLGGNLDYNNAITQLYGKGIVTPDFSAELLLNKDGSFKLVGFNRTTIEATTGQSNRSALQLSYRKDVDRFWDIFRSKRRITYLDSLRNLKAKVPKSAG
jgi:TamB, inner membrane protein subunit of TAM complex